MKIFQAFCIGCITLFIIDESLTAHEPADLPGLLLDLNPSKGVSVEKGERVVSWENQALGKTARLFVKQDIGREEKGSGQPTLRNNVETLNGYSSIIFRQQELVNMEEDAFDHLTQGVGYTWVCVLAVYSQRIGLKDVNSFFGNLRNGQKYEGFWGCLRDDNTLWTGARNGLTFGRFDSNNPLLLGNRLEINRYYVVAGTMAAGTGNVQMQLFINSMAPVSTGIFPVRRESNPSRMVIGQERDAIEHPGKESFDGEIGRFLIYERPLKPDELSGLMHHLKVKYGIKD